MGKNKILLLFPDGVGIRNYLYSDVFKDSEADLVLFHNFDSKTINAIQQKTSITAEIPIPRYKESVREKFLRELICLSRLHYNNRKVNNKSLLTNWNWNQKTFSKKLFYKLIERIASFIKQYSSILKLEKKYQTAIRQNSFYHEVKDILIDLKPDSIFCSHQRALQCAPIFAVAEDLDIKTTTVIYSWDNLPKARLALRADNYLVWSDYMKQEMELYYPEIPAEKVLVTGTPQFECYGDENRIITKDDFYNRYQLDSSKKIICFSGDDVKTSPDDPQYLRDLATELIQHKLDKKYQILLRRCPVDVSGRFDSIIAEYPTLIKQAAPVWNFDRSANWTTIYPLPEDVSLLVSTAYYCDAVINVGSTMAFDFGMFNKPCVFINYDQKVKTNPDWSVKTIYQFQHFKSMPDKNVVSWWNQKAEITAILNDLNYNGSMDIWTSKILGEYTKASKEIRKIVEQ